MTGVTFAVRKQFTFLFDCYFNSDFDCSCATIDEPISCIEMVEFGYEDICQVCKKKLFVFILAIF